MDAEEINAPFKLATEKFPGVVFRSKIEIKKYLKECKLVVIGILGDGKSGKSTLMNLMAKYLQYDKNGHYGWMEDLIDKTMNVEGITTNTILSRQRNDINFCEDGGLYTWPQPFLLRNPGQNEPDDKIAVLLLDLNMNCITPSMQLLMCLLCSTLIYNTTSTDVSHFCTLIDTIRQSSLQFFSEGILYKCKDLLFRQLTIVFRDCSQETSGFEYLSEIFKQNDNQTYDVLNGIPYKNCYLLPNPKQAQINSRDYLKTEANFSQNLANLITQTLRFDKLSPKLYNDHSITVETFFSMLDAMCSIVIFPLSQELNELHFLGAQADDQMNTNEFKSSVTQMHPEHAVQTERAENMISQKELEANYKMNGLLGFNPQWASSPIKEWTVDPYQPIPNLQTDNMMQIYDVCDAEFIKIVLPLPLEMLDHKQIIGNFTGETSSTMQDDTENNNYLKVIINPFPIPASLTPSQRGQGCRLYEKRASNEFKNYQHAEKTQKNFETKFIEEYKKRLKSGSFLNSAVEEIFDNLMKESVQEYVSINPDVPIDELLKAVYKLSDTQKCLNKIGNIQLVQRQYLLEMNKRLEMYHFFSPEQLYEFHSDATEKSFSLCEEKTTRKILDIGFSVLFDEYDKINNEILQCEENTFKDNIIPKLTNFYDIEMINVTKRKITTIQLKMAHEKLKEECKVVIQNVYLVRSDKIPFLDTCFEKVDKMFKSSLKIYIEANKSKIKTVQTKIQSAIESSQINYNETMSKKIENKTFSPSDLIHLHKECFKNASRTLKLEIGSIDQTEEPRSHLDVLDVKTQMDLANFTEENNARKKKQELERRRKRKARKREAAEKMKQLNVEPPPLKNQTSQNQHPNEECENDDETINIPVNELVQNSNSVKLQLDAKIVDYKQYMAELLSSYCPLTNEMLLRKHNDFIDVAVGSILKTPEEIAAAQNDLQAMIDRLNDIYKSYRKCAENDRKNYPHITTLKVLISQLFDQNYEKGLKSGSFLTTKSEQIINDINEAAVNKYTANTPNVSKEDMMNIVNRLTKMQNKVGKTEDLQNLLRRYLSEMNQKIETHTSFYHHNKMSEFSTAAKKKILPLTGNRNDIFEKGVQILNNQYVEILTKINELDILFLGHIETALSKTSFWNTTLSTQLDSIHNKAKLEIKSFSETVSVIQPDALLKLIILRIEKRLYDVISQISLGNFSPEFDKEDVQEASNKNKSTNADTSKARIIQLTKICNDSIQIELTMKNDYHKPMNEMFSKNFPVPLEMLSEKHKQLIKDITKQMSCVCKHKSIKLTDLLNIINPRFEQAYKTYVERAENDLSNYKYTKTIVRTIFEEIFPHFYEESLISGEFMDSDPNGIVKKLIGMSMKGLECHPDSVHITKEITTSSFFKFSETRLSLKIKCLQRFLKLFVVQINEQLKANHFFTIEQLHNILKNANQKALQPLNDFEDNYVLEFGLLILCKLYETCNEDIIKHESSIFRATIIPRIINFYDEEMKIVTQEILTAVEIIVAGEELKKECLQAIQKACSFNQTNIQVLHTVIEEMNSVFEFKMNFYIQKNQLKIERMQTYITKWLEKSKTIYKVAIESQVQGKIFSLVELMNLHKDSVFEAITYLRQTIRRNNQNVNPTCSIKVLRIFMEQHFAQILKQNHYKKFEVVERKESGNDVNADGVAAEKV